MTQKKEFDAGKLEELAVILAEKGWRV